jgi:hypothetical protein
MLRLLRDFQEKAADLEPMKNLAAIDSPEG